MPQAAAVSGERVIEMTRDESERVARGEIVLREVGNSSSRGKTFEAVAVIEAEPVATYRVLTEFDAYHEFMPNISSTRVLSEGEGEAVVDFVLGLPLGKTKKYRLQLEFHEDGGGAHISWHMVNWPGLAAEESIGDTSGFWRLLPYPNRAGKTLALYHVFTDPGEVPPGTGWIISLLSEKSLPRAIRQMRKRVRERADEERMKWRE